jgi:hypothetical protein
MAPQPAQPTTHDTTAERITARALLAVIDHHRRWATLPMDGTPQALRCDADLAAATITRDVLLRLLVEDLHLAPSVNDLTRTLEQLAADADLLIAEPTAPSGFNVPVAPDLTHAQTLIREHRSERGVDTHTLTVYHAGSVIFSGWWLCRPDGMFSDGFAGRPAGNRDGQPQFAVTRPVVEAMITVHADINGGQPVLLGFDGDELIVNLGGDVKPPGTGLRRIAPQPDGTWLVGFGWPWQPVEAHQVATVHGLDGADGRHGHGRATRDGVGE